MVGSLSGRVYFNEYRPRLVEEEIDFPYSKRTCQNRHLTNRYAHILNLQLPKYFSIFLIMKTDLEKIISKLKQELPKIETKYHVSTLEIFGSYVRNEQKSNSDIDILVTFTKAPSLFKFIELEDYLSEVLGIKVDLVMKNALKPNIGKRILSESQPIL